MERKPDEEEVDPLADPEPDEPAFDDDDPDDDKDE